MLCGFNTAWFFWDQVTTSMWIPWLLWATVRYLAAEDAKWLPAVALASFLMILGGFPAVAAFGFYSFALVVLVWITFDHYDVLQQAHRRHSAALRVTAVKALLPFLAVGLAFLMSSFILLPFVENMRQINLGYRANAGSSFDGLRDLLLFLTWETPLKVERTAYIGFPVLLFAVAGMIRTVRAPHENMRRFAVSMAVLVFLGVAMLFGFVPEGLVRALPVFSSNHWSRMIVIPLLGLAALSSLGLELVSLQMTALCSRFKIAPWRAGQVAAAAVILVVAGQFFLQKRFFNTYNAVVPAAWFYPATPSLDYVKGRLQPLQSVIADSSFMVSGTLGAYGIADWYAHAYRTDREKEVLSRLVIEPFASPTAAFISGGDIQFNSALMDQLAVRYLLLRSDWNERKATISLPEFTKVAAPSLARGPWRQHLSVPDAVTVGALGFQFLTGGRSAAPADVLLSLYNDGGQKYAFEPRLSRHAIADNQWSFFEFPGKVMLAKGSYLLVLSLADQGGGEGLSASASRMPVRTGNYLEINNAPSDISLNMKIGIYERTGPGPIPKKWSMTGVEENIVVMENGAVTDGAYHVKGLDASKDLPDYSGVAVERPSSDLVTVRYSKQSPGWVVLPMHLHSGWKAYLNDRQVPYDTYLGMLPAIPVQGPARIEFKYRPASITRGSMLSLAGVVVFAVFTWMCVKRGGKPSERFLKKGERT